MHKTTAISRSFAIASLGVELGAGSAPSEIRLIPAAPFRAVDGRPEGVDAWYLDDAQAAALVATVNARQSACVIDFEHQTLHARQNGQPAPAAGWYRTVEWRTGDGLYAVDVEWTADAAAMIADRKYRYISPVFAWDKKTGAIQALICAALTNNPGVDGLTDLSVLAALATLLTAVPLSQENPMDELLEQLRWLLNMPVGATADDVAAQLQKLIDQIKAGPAQAAASFDLAAHLVAVHGEISTLKAAVPDPAKFVEIATLTAVRDELTAAQTELAGLKAANHQQEVERVVTEALNVGKLTPALEGWARDLGKNNLAALNAFLGSAVAIAPPGRTQTDGKPPSGTGNATAALSAEETAVCAQLGISPEDYLKTAGQS